MLLCGLELNQLEMKWKWFVCSTWKMPDNMPQWPKRWNREVQENLYLGALVVMRLLFQKEIVESEVALWKAYSHCKIAWFQKGNKMLVISCCVVKFTMRDVIYDDAWWDVVPVDACHILLGRMWLYVKGMFHHNKPCSFSFYKDEKKFALQLHKEEDANTSKTTTSTW